MTLWEEREDSNVFLTADGKSLTKRKILHTKLFSFHNINPSKKEMQNFCSVDSLQFFHLFFCKFIVSWLHYAQILQCTIILEKNCAIFIFKIIIWKIVLSIFVCKFCRISVLLLAENNFWKLRFLFSDRVTYVFSFKDKSAFVSPGMYIIGNQFLGPLNWITDGNLSLNDKFHWEKSIKLLWR